MKNSICLSLFSCICIHFTFFAAASSEQPHVQQKQISSLHHLCRKAITQDVERTRSALAQLDAAHPESTELFAQCVNSGLLKRISLHPQEIKGLVKSVSDLSFSPDGTTLLSASDNIMRL